VYYGQRGRISAREVYDHVNACSCLTLILACIVYWQAREISRMVAAPDFPFGPDLLRHISPIEWKNVVLYGEIKIDPATGSLYGGQNRPLVAARYTVLGCPATAADRHADRTRAHGTPAGSQAGLTRCSIH
ncbi:MAG: Tn3 family transposase, partial [Chloroflexi bacterium]|nr:Tn3 family transposase [Chloroflexota bacterium]